MILAEKITQMRKKNGWSQETLAEKLQVSRQTVSKWEGAQSVPDLNRILQLAEIFGVSTDYLLKDEVETVPSLEGDLESIPTEPLRGVTMEQANAYLDHQERASKHVSLGVLLCILCPVPMILLAGAQEAGRIGLSEGQAGGLGVVVLMLLIGVAVAIFVVQSMKDRAFEWLKTEELDTAYGVDSMVRSRREAYRPRYVRMLTGGIVLCVLSAVPVIAVGAFADSGKDKAVVPVLNTVSEADSDMAAIIAVGVLLIMVAIGVLCIVRCSGVWSGYQVLLETGEYSRKNKNERKKNESFSKIYWACVIGLYLAISFLTQRWDRTWIIWPVAAVSVNVFLGIVTGLRTKES